MLYENKTNNFSFNFKFPHSPPPSARRGPKNGRKEVIPTLILQKVASTLSSSYFSTSLVLMSVSQVTFSLPRDFKQASELYFHLRVIQRATVSCHYVQDTAQWKKEKQREKEGGKQIYSGQIMLQSSLESSSSLLWINTFDVMTFFLLLYLPWTWTEK